MRQIGSLPSEAEASTLADHLLSLGITTRLLPDREGWGVWVHNEDRLAQARAELEAFRSDPENPRYQQAGKSAEAVRREQAKLDRQFRKNYRTMSGAWDSPNLRRRPFTSLVVVISVGVFLWMNSGARGSLWVTQHLTFASLQRGAMSDGLDPIRHGELWRLITPVFIHSGGMHILFNVWAWITLGTAIEYRRGTRTLLILFLLSAVASDSGEYVYEMAHYGIPLPFGGLSGVVYAVFGYVWVLGRIDPTSGMMLHPRSVRIMLLWLLLCFTGYVGNVANAAHVVGLIVGMLYGLARF